MKGLTVEEVIEYQRTHPYKKQVYGKWGNLNENNPILQDVDLKKLREFILNNSDVKTQSTYRIVEKFRQANGITT